ncbi:DUF1289 domain-containing protein [Paracoccus versutus]
MKPSTPCVNICRIEPASRLCTGCLRSIDEIAGWGHMTEAERLAIMAELPSRALPACGRAD